MQASFLSFLLEKGKDFYISEAVHVRESLLTTSVESSNIDFRYPLKKLSKNFCSYNKFPLFWNGVYTSENVQAFFWSLGQ